MSFLKYVLLVFLVIPVLRYRSRGDKQQRIVDKGFRAGLLLGGIGFALGLLLGFAITLVPGDQTFAGLGPLYGLLIAGPAAFAVGFPVGFLWGAGRQWFRESAL